MVEPKLMDQLAELRAALEDEGADRRKIADVGLSIVQLLLRKNKDYGSSVFKSPVLAPSMDAGSAILVRMSDKISRLNNLLQAEAQASVDESIDDTLADLAGYAILYLARPKHDRSRSEVAGSHGADSLSEIDDAS